MFKKILALLLCLALAVSLAACGTPAEPTEPAKVTDPQPTSPKPTEPKPTEPQPTEPQPTEPQATEPATDPVAAVDLEKLNQDCLALMGEMIPLDEGMMLDFCGIQIADCQQAFVSISADGLLTDEIWIIQAVDEEAAQRLLDKIAKRLKAKADESETYSPVQYAVVQKAVTIQEDTYVILLVAPNVEQLQAVAEAALGIQ